jgi:hypothetical protein
MSNEELKVIIEELGRKVDRVTPHKERYDWFKIMVASFGVLILTFIFSAGILYRDFQELKDCAIPPSEWQDVKGKTNATYKHVFKIPDAAYQTRGGGTNQ